MGRYGSKSELFEGSGKPFMTQSMIESFTRCPEAFRRAYIEGERIPPGIAMAKGSAVHRGAEVNMHQKIETHSDLPPNNIIDAAVAGFDAEIRDGIAFDVDEESRGPGIVIGEARDAVAEMAEVHARQQAPDYQPVLVEESVEIELPNAEVNLRGTIDLADDQRRVIDFKTSKRKKSQDDADSSIQLTVYAAAYHARTGSPSSGQRIDCVVQTKTKTYRNVISTERGAADYASLALRINVIRRSIVAGIFPPTTPGSWWCSSTFCGYWNTCPYVNSHRVQLLQLETS